jgi:hypothetical protein
MAAKKGMKKNKRAYEAYKVYSSMEEPRSLSLLSDETGYPTSTLIDWNKRFNWEKLLENSKNSKPQEKEQTVVPEDFQDEVWGEMRKLCIEALFKLRKIVLSFEVDYEKCKDIRYQESVLKNFERLAKTLKLIEDKWQLYEEEEDNIELYEDEDCEKKYLRIVHAEDDGIANKYRHLCQ